MSISAIFLPEFDEEMKITRRLLERVPGDRGAWKPHEKSFSLGHLAQLVSWMPGWITQCMRETKLDLSGAPRYSLEKTDTLLQLFDTNVAEARAGLAAAGDADFQVPWSLTSGDRAIACS
jgi:hypothetical protein